LAAIGKVERIRETKNKTTTETAYYLLSTALTPERLNEVARSHWGVENQLHWQAGRRPERGSGQNPSRQWPTQSRRTAPHGAERHAEGHNQRLPAHQVHAHRMG
jgi:hypothetical protein